MLWGVLGVVSEGEGHVSTVTTNIQQPGSARYHSIFDTV